jgi:hypothetical protein
MRPHSNSKSGLCRVVRDSPLGPEFGGGCQAPMIQVTTVGLADLPKESLRYRRRIGGISRGSAAVTIQQSTLWVDDEAVHLGIWPAELAAQYKALFADPARREGLLDLAGRPGWTCTPNMHVAYRFATGPQRWYPRKQKQLPLATYFDQWTADLGHHGAGMRTKAQLKSAAFRKWTLDRGYADAADLADLRVWLDAKKSTTKFQIRPGIELKRSWAIKDATDLDRTGELLKRVHSAINDALTALNEPTLKPIAGHTQ